MARLIGYARVSTVEQDPQLQLDALNKAGCAEIFTDKASGTRGSRPGLDACLAALEPDDTLVVWRLDRLGRSMPHLVSLVEELLGKGIGFRSLLDGAIDTTTASGELMFNIFSSLAQFERRLIQERTQAGLAAARARGRLGGRRPISPNDPRVVTAKRLHRDRSLSIDHICATLGISRPTFYRYLALPNASAKGLAQAKCPIRVSEWSNSEYRFRVNDCLGRWGREVLLYRGPYFLLW